MKTAYDKPNIARRIYDALTSAPSSPTGVTIDHLAVMIRDLGTEIRGMEGRMMNALDTRINVLSNNIAGTSEKKKGYTEDETEKDFLDSKLTKDKTIANDDAIVMN